MLGLTGRTPVCSIYVDYGQAGHKNREGGDLLLSFLEIL